MSIDFLTESNEQIRNYVEHMYKELDNPAGPSLDLNTAVDFIEITNHYKEVMLELVKWLESPEVQGAFTMAAIHGYGATDEFIRDARMNWDKARSLTGFVKEVKKNADDTV